MRFRAKSYQRGGSKPWCNTLCRAKMTWNRSDRFIATAAICDACQSTSTRLIISCRAGCAGSRRLAAANDAPKSLERGRVTFAAGGLKIAAAKMNRPFSGMPPALCCCVVAPPKRPKAAHFGGFHAYRGLGLRGVGVVGCLESDVIGCASLRLLLWGFSIRNGSGWTRSGRGGERYLGRWR